MRCTRGQGGVDEIKEEVDGINCGWRENRDRGEGWTAEVKKMGDADKGVTTYAV